MSIIRWLFPRYNERQLLSLAGVLQSASLVNAYANTGTADSQGFDRCLLALLNTSPESDFELFGEKQELRTGISELINFCQGHQQNQATMRYSIQILHLQKLLYKKEEVQQKIQAGLTHAQKQMHIYGIEDGNLIRNLADLYQSTISTLGFRIQIAGKQQFLQQDLIAARIRVLLFSGVRFAYLWRQSGGHAHHLVTAKRSIGQCAEKLAV